MGKHGRAAALENPAKPNRSGSWTSAGNLAGAVRPASTCVSRAAERCQRPKRNPGVSAGAHVRAGRRLRARPVLGDLLANPGVGQVGELGDDEEIIAAE